MRQPELGKRVSELRIAKGLTQEELAEKCTITARTIQRIEAGEVTPRIYTIKTILAALDYDISTIKDYDKGIFQSFIVKINRFLLLDVDFSQTNDFLKAQLNIAWIFGIFYVILGFLEGAAEYLRYKENTILFGEALYAVLKISVLITYVLFQRGFILLGGVFKNYLLKIVSYILIFGSFLITSYDVASVFYNSVEREFILGAEALTFGGIGIIYGMSLTRLRKTVGNVSAYAGIFEIIAGCFFLTLIFSFVGFIVLIPAELLEIVVLYKGLEIMKNQEKGSYA